MEINIYNPAAAVETISQKTRNGASLKPLETTPRISQLSLQRAASGDPNLSAETLAAIASGKVIPPTIQAPKEAPQSNEETTQPSAHSQEPVSVRLTPQAQQYIPPPVESSNAQKASFNSAAASLGVDIQV